MTYRTRRWTRQRIYLARRLIEATPTTKPRDIRDRAILETLYATGIRRAELLGLTIYDADLQTATLRIEHGKGNTTRIVPLTQSAIAALKLYLEEARGIFAREAGQVRLFVSTRSGGPLDDDDIVRIVRKAATRAGIKKHVTPHTLRHWLSIIRSFFVWMNRNGRLLHNPSERLTFPRRDQPLPHVLNEQEIAHLIEKPDIETAIGLRDRALMETLYATGIRHAEAHRLDLYDVDTAAHRLTVRLGKGQRDRLVPLTETAADWLSRYVTTARPELAAGKLWGKGRRRNQRKRSQSSPTPWALASTPALWLAVSGRRLCYGCIADRIRDYAVQVELKATVHTFRHCCATHLLRGGASIRHVQQLLGHRDLSTTEIYTHVELSDLQHAIAGAQSTFSADRRENALTVDLERIFPSEADR